MSSSPTTDLRPLIQRAHQEVMLELELHLVLKGAGMPWGLPYFSQTPQGTVRWYPRPDLFGQPIRQLRCSLCGGAMQRDSWPARNGQAPDLFINIVGMPKGVRDPRYVLILDGACLGRLRPWIDRVYRRGE